ncbi:RNA polymerase sigma factor [Brucella sp. 21LCYQ03]|nr:RNA polymerase sigma factor [Brucella sp. 21LCYQ03]
MPALNQSEKSSLPSAFPLQEIADVDLAITDYYDELCRAVRRRGHVSSNANEIVHDLYVRLKDRKTDLEGKSSLRAFLTRAAINLGLDRFRREQLEARLFSGTAEEAANIISADTDPDIALDMPQRLNCLRNAIMELPYRQRRIFIAHRIGNLPPDEIAVRFGITRNMVDRHLRKALIHCLYRLDELEQS